jgi:serine/threonine-protein kinase
MAERYDIIDTIGRGGMGVVYRARDRKQDSIVALKRPHPGAELVGTEARHEFEDEADMLARVEGHPAVVDVYDFGIDAKGPYLVMRHIEGESLRERLRSAGTLSPSETAALGIRLAEGGQHAHDNGVLHRDLKPGNVLLERGEMDKAVLVDFGIAYLLKRTTTATQAGTPAYMSPEQLKGHDIDVRSDVYGLGAVLYECASGVPPYGAADGVRGMAQILFRILDEDREPLLEAAPDVPAWLATVVDRCLETKPEERYESAADVMDDLQAGETAEAASTEPPTEPMTESDEPSVGEMVERGNAARERSNYHEAVHWYRKAAAANSPEAQFRLGEFHRKGWGVSQHQREAARWYENAARQGHAEAQCQLGRMYEEGTGVSQDMGNAESWYRKGAQQENPEGEYLLGRLLLKEGRMHREGTMWLKNAASHGHSAAKEFVSSWTGRVGEVSPVGVHYAVAGLLFSLNSFIFNKDIIELFGRSSSLSEIQLNHLVKVNAYIFLCCIIGLAMTILVYRACIWFKGRVFFEPSMYVIYAVLVSLFAYWSPGSTKEFFGAWFVAIWSLPIVGALLANITVNINGILKWGKISVMLVFLIFMFLTSTCWLSITIQFSGMVESEGLEVWRPFALNMLMVSAVFSLCPILSLVFIGYTLSVVERRVNIGFIDYRSARYTLP